MSATSDKHQDMIFHSQDPLNVESPLELLAGSSEVPREAFYVRNHGTIPEISAEGHRLTVSGLVENPLSLSLADLRDRFPQTTVEATLHCAGNRRDELAEVSTIPGELLWGPGAIGNARWSGVRLADLLHAAGVSEEACHAAFAGVDEPYEGDSPSFGGSIPLHKASSPEILLAYEMNGEPLPVEHGFPLRAIVPGYIGARSVKWLSQITLQAQPSDNYFQRQSYRLFPPWVGSDEEAGDSDAFPLGEISVNAVICEPADEARLPAGEVTVRGVAVAGGDRIVQRVDVTADGGRSWTGADLSEARSPWAWRRWEARLSLEPGTYRISARAVDSASDTQPEDAASLWNIKGYVNNAWHQTRVGIQ